MPRAKVDRLGVSAKDCAERFPAIFQRLMGRDGVRELVFEGGKATHGFKHAERLRIDGILVATRYWGGDSQRGRCYVDVTGKGCTYVDNWGEAAELLSALPGARLTRVDLAADFVGGEVRYSDVLAAYHAGRFKSDRGGPNPKIREQTHGGDPLMGCTLYVGNAESEMQACCYEKGMQVFEGLLEAEGEDMIGIVRNAGPDGVRLTQEGIGADIKPRDWFRCEVRFRRGSRELDWSVLVERDEYFAGAYPYFAELLPMASASFFLRPPMLAQASVWRSISQLRHQWGSTLFTLQHVYGGDFRKVWAQIVGEGHNEKLVEAGALALRDEISRAKREARET